MRLQIRHADVSYGADNIIEDVNFEIHDKEKIAVVGRNGCGKTTLFRLITGELVMTNPDSDEKCGYTIAGNQEIGILRQINFEDKEITAENEIKKVFKDIIFVKERMAEVEKKLSANDSDHDALLDEYDKLQKRFDAMDGYSYEREMTVMFQQFGFSIDDLQKPMGHFSGGQQTKIAFMKLLLSKPDILLLDEPTNHLDLPTIEWLEGYLKNYPRAVVIISHDRAFLDNIVSVTYEIEYGKITRYAGNYTAFVNQKEENLIKQEKDYEAQQKEIKRLTEWIEQWKNTPTKVSSVNSKRKVIEHMVKIEKPRMFDNRTFKAFFDPRIESYSDVLIADKLSIGYDSELSTVSFTLRKGERLAVIGENGKGKSTLLKTIVGDIPQLGGSFIFGKNVEFGYFDQQQALMNDEDPEKTVLENFWDTYPRLKNEDVRGALGAFMFSQEEVETKIKELSGGQRVRLALCKMFYSRPNLLILDEPTNHMDMLGKESLEQMLSSFEGTVLVVSHDRYFIKQISTCILDFEKDKTTFYNYNYEDYLAEKKKKELRESEQILKAQTQTQSKTQAPGKQYNNPGKILSKLKAKKEKLEQQLSETETEISSLKEEMDNPANASSYSRLIELQKKIEEKELVSEDILMQIMEIEEEMEEMM